MANEWYYLKNGERRGPVSNFELKVLADNGSLSRSDLVWSAQLTDWTPANAVRGLFPPVAEGENSAIPIITDTSAANPLLIDPTPKKTSTYTRSKSTARRHPVESGDRVYFSEAFGKVPGIAIANILPLAANLCIFLLVCWIPWINLGALIGLFAVCCKMTAAGKLHPAEVLNPKYRGQLGNFMVLLSMMSGGIMMCLIAMALPWISASLLMTFMGTGTPNMSMNSSNMQQMSSMTRQMNSPNKNMGMPLSSMNVPKTTAAGKAGIVMLLGTISSAASFTIASLSLFCGWLLAPLLVLDKGMDPSEALAKSNQLMNGNRITFCLVNFVYALILGVLSFAILFFTQSVLSVLGVIISTCVILISEIIFLACIGFFYGRLAADGE